ncbi:MAG: S41 family peptidase [Rikenellaceae bacterium]
MNKDIAIIRYFLLLITASFIAGCDVDFGAEVNDPETEIEEQTSNNIGSATDTNLWIGEYMEEMYLWNEEFIAIKSTLDYSADSQAFFAAALNAMENIDEDGKYYNGERYYYSSLTLLSDSSSKASSTVSDYGISMMYYTYGESSNNYYFLVACVKEDSPAALAGIERGTLITSYNGSNINDSNMTEGFNTLMGYSTNSTTLSLGLAEYQISGKNYSVATLGEVEITPTSYQSNPIIHTQTYQSPNKEKTIAYMVYSEFDMDADEKLIDAFAQFKAEGADELILDLRYNGGGDVYSSAVIASSIVDSSRSGELFCEMEYNQTRTAAGEVDYFYIGQYPTVANYKPIVIASASSLGLYQVYILVSSYTASASELIINGLQGLGIDVWLVGSTTEGKNVGMEVVESSYDVYSKYDFDNCEYQLAPITFYSLNAVGNKDYSSGFGPDYPSSESALLTAWGDDSGNDPLLAAALSHIYYNSWNGITSKADSGENKPQIIANSDLKPRPKNMILNR